MFFRTRFRRGASEAVVPGWTPRDDGDAAGSDDRRAAHALFLLHTHRGDPAREIDALLAAEPRSTPGHSLRAALIVGADDHAARSPLARSIAVLEAGPRGVDARARRHAAAARAWLDGDAALSLSRYGDIVVDAPRDILALVVAHALDFRLGRRRMLRDRVAQVLPEWNASMAGYASILAMYAFGLEENGQYRRAERAARKALDLDPGHPGAIHALAHVMEMQGRAREGGAFLDATRSQWMQGNGFSVHLAWHRALFHLDLDDPRAALDAYDTTIAPARGLAALADASALLWRLELRDVDVSGRWQSLADHWQRQPLLGARPFYAVHAMMAYAAAGRAASVREVFDMFQGSTGGTSLLLPEEALGRPLCEALVAFARHDYALCIERLREVRDIAHRCGGSLAQCDVIHLTFTEAALRAREPRLARALVAERAARKPGSRFNQRLLARVGLVMPAGA
ncbi:MAG TPA: tetratricopeptide repeat protein [Casimicrobiaceae bacterium]|nr:tetratricopeptide repeat protein [Casimicrobiaceae bacterium]